MAICHFKGPMPPISILLSLAPILTTLLAETICRTMSRGIPPLEDCLAITSHIPSIADTTDAAGSKYPPSFPFFPRAYLIHSNCTVRISYSSTTMPPSAVPGLLHAVMLQHRKTPATPLSATSIFRIWLAARLAITNVLRDCLAYEWVGSDFDLVDVPEIENAWYLVQIFRTERESPLQQRLQDERAAMIGPADDDDDDGLNGLFKISIWEVP